MLRVKKITDRRGPRDGVRVLVTRSWPKGVRRSEAAVDLWLSSLAPSARLMQWYRHDPAKWKKFSARYREELEGRTETLEGLRRLLDHCRSVTLLHNGRHKLRNPARIVFDALRNGRR